MAGAADVRRAAGGERGRGLDDHLQHSVAGQPGAVVDQVHQSLAVLHAGAPVAIPPPAVGSGVRGGGEDLEGAAAVRGAVGVDDRGRDQQQPGVAGVGLAAVECLELGAQSLGGAEAAGGRQHRAARLGLEFTAVIAGNDLLALGCYDVFRERDIACPGD